LRAPIKLKDLSGKDYHRLIERSAFQLEKTIPKVIPIINQVREKGDEAVVDLTRRFDGVDLSPTSLRVGSQKIKQAYKKVSPSLIDSLRKMCKQVKDFHRNQLKLRRNWSIVKTLSGSYTLGEFFSPVEKAAIYVPGGKASYPSTAIMGCVPAKLAGVSEVVVCSPPSSGGEIAPEVLVASDIAGADLVINAGGAQVVAAVAYGTETIPKVDVIAGPGNIYVTAAKAYLASLGQVGIDCPAGPSEILTIADDSAPPVYVVWDILAQAEHDEASYALVVTTSEKLAREIYTRIEEEMRFARRKNIIRSCLNSNGFILLVDTLEEAAEFANRFAPEHLEIITQNPDEILPLIKNAGSVFLGPFSPVAAGDYFTGCNHILPTGGAARCLSGLSVNTFLKRITYQKLSLEALSRMRGPVSHLASKEGFQAHLRSVETRLKN